MTTEIKVPELPNDIGDVKVTNVHVDVGDIVLVNSPLFDIETDKTILEIHPSGSIKNGISNLGPVNEQNYFDNVKLSKLNQTLIKTYDKLFSLKISFLKFLDKIKPIKNNLRYMLIALIGSSIYFLINHFYDDFLQKLINDSNLAQSVIVFLSISSIINIFHPFTLRKELSISEVDELYDIKEEKMREELEDDGVIEKYTRY